jgi:hypothetical protein
MLIKFRISNGKWLNWFAISGMGGAPQKFWTLAGFSNNHLIDGTIKHIIR